MGETIPMFDSPWHPSGPAMSSAKDDWLTPKWVVERVHRFGGIALDPCPAVGFNWVDSETCLGANNGLKESWETPGLVFVNPPYGRDIRKWTKRALAFRQLCGDIVLLVPARTDTKWFQELAAEAPAICFIKGRLKFIKPDTLEETDPAPFPSALVWFGTEGGFGDVFGDLGLVWERDEFRE